MDLHGKVVLLTGGARMGTAIGERLGRAGARLIFTYRQSKKSAEESVLALKKHGISARALRCDVSSDSALQKLSATVLKTEKRLDAVVHLASIYEKINLSSVSARAALASLDAHFKIHARAAFGLAQTLSPLMKRSGGGRFVFISDWTAASGRPRYKGFTPYYISKVAVQGVVEGLALELAPDILVNGIAPGPILPPPGLSKAEYRDVCRATPVGRWGGADEIAKAVAFLMDTDFVTGETIRVDGGRHLS